MTPLAGLLAAVGLAADAVPPPVPCPSDLTVGCFYFPGHFSPLRWMPFKQTGFPTPLMGYYRDGEPEVSDWHIKWAVEHGISFFAFDWYYDYEHGASTEHNKALDEGFLRARYRDRMNFCLMWCNEGKEEKYTAQHIEKLARILAERYFRQPNHLRINGDNVLIFSRPRRLLESFGTEGTAAMFRCMSAITRQAGCGGVYPVALEEGNVPELKQAGFRATTAYNYPESGMTDEQRKAGRAPYALMVRGYEENWKRVRAQSDLPYIVPVSPGWDSRPWYGDRALVRTSARPELYRQMCQAARNYVDPQLRMVLAECWNEFGEGSYIEPTVQYGFGHLDAMRDAFCPNNPHHDDITPASLDRTVPVFSNLPTSVESLMASGSNLLYNGDIESGWGWVQYDGRSAPLDRAAHAGQYSLCVRGGTGVKSQWLMPIPKGRAVRLSLWYRLPEGAKLSITAALFTGQAWLGRYAEIAQLEDTLGQWKQLDRSLTLADLAATDFDIEFVARGGDCLVDDVDVRVATTTSASSR